MLSRRGLGKDLRLRVSVKCLQCLHLGGDLPTSKYLVTSALAGPFFDSQSFLVLDSPEIPLLRFLE